MKREPIVPSQMQIRISDCYGVQTNSIPPCFGDNEIVICPNCKSQCTGEWQPMYYEVSKGTWRKAYYSKTAKPLTALNEATDQL